MDRKYVILVVIFLLTLGSRLYFAYETEGLDNSAYFHVKQVDSIRESGRPLFYDDLSYGGRYYQFPPLFDYVLAILTFIFPAGFVFKFFPNFFASFSVIVIYALANRISKNSLVSLTSAFIAGFVPVFFSVTFNSLSPYTLLIPLLLYSIYALDMLKNDKRYVNIFLFLMFLLPLISPSVLLFIISLVFYLFLTNLEGLQEDKKDLEIILFSTFFVLLIFFLIFKNAFLSHGPNLIFKNIPPELFSDYFTKTTILESIYLIGLVPFLIGVYSVYRYTYREKSKHIYITTAFAIVVFIALSLKLVEPKEGLIYLGFILILGFIHHYKVFMSYFRITKFARFEPYVAAMVILIVVLTSVVPSFQYARDENKNVPSLGPFMWVSEFTEPNSTVLATIDEGFLVNAIGKRKNVIDSNFLFVPHPEEVLKDVSEIYLNHYKTTTIKLLNKYDINYIMFTPHAKSYYGIDSLFFIDDNCFSLVYDSNNTQIYESLCRLE